MRVLWTTGQILAAFTDFPRLIIWLLFIQRSDVPDKSESISLSDFYDVAVGKLSRRNEKLLTAKPIGTNP